MNTPDAFFLIVLATITATRVWLFSRPIASPKIGNIKMHHYMYGIIVLAVGLVLKNLIVYSIGVGLIVDELPPLFFSKKFSWEEYESKKTFTGVLILLVLIYIFRSHIIPTF